ncbi:MAG: hypothetical protein ACLFP2_02820 [Candidatus Woesearchaeota archaeon]
MKKVLLFILLAICVYADGIEVHSQEKGQVISFYEEYFIVNINGTISIDNPTKTHIYAINIPLDLAPLQLRLINSSKATLTKENKIIINELPANSSLSFKFNIKGITTDKSIMNHSGIFIRKIRKELMEIHTPTIGKLNKAPLEDPAQGGEENTRLISATYKNPTNFTFRIKKATIIKTPDQNINNELDKWEFEKEDGELGPHEQWNIDFIDEDAYEGEVYWLSTDINLKDIYFDEDLNITYLDQDELFKPEENQTNVTENASTLEFMKDRLFVRKKVSKKLVNPGETIDVTLLVNNFNPKKIKSEVKDTIPDGFRVIETKGKQDGRELTWDNVSLNSQETRRISYKLRYTDNDSLGVDYFNSAEVHYKNGTIYSQPISFVRMYVPEKKLFIQKGIKFLNDDQVRVTIKLQNMGESDITQLVMNELLEKDSEFKEITKQFHEKGIWKVDKIKRGDTWEVSYVTDKINVLNTFPLVYGIPESSTMKTVILSNVVSSDFTTGSLRFIEIGGLIALGIVIIFLVLPVEVLQFKRKKERKDLQKMENEIDSLKEKTEAKITPQPKATTTKQQTTKHTSSDRPDVDNDKKRENLSKGIEETNKQLNDIKNKLDMK